MINVSPEELVEEHLLFYEALRRLGFTRDEIYSSDKIRAMDVPELVCFGLVVKVDGHPLEDDGHPEWCVTIGTCSDPEAFKAAWLRAAEDPDSIDAEKMKRLWKEKMPLEKFLAIGASIERKGLPLRAVNKKTESMYEVMGSAKGRPS